MKYFDLTGRIFDLPIAEIIDKRHDGILFFSKIRVENVYFIPTQNSLDFILNPLQIRYYNRNDGRQKVIWDVEQFKETEKNGIDITDKDLQNIHMRAMVFKWLDKERIDDSSIIDFGPFIAIKEATSHVLNKDEIDEYVIKMDELEKNNIKKIIRRMDEYDKEEFAKKIRALRKFLPKSNLESIKSYKLIKKEMKFYNK